MPDLNERDAKLVQYLNEAYGKEQELVSALQAHIAMTTKRPYKKRLQQHLRETKAHAKQLERRIKQLGGGGHALQTMVAKATAAAKAPLHAIRGDGEQEKMLKNAKTEYFNEHEEIGNYLAIEHLAQRLGDGETARLARAIRREEERMAKFLEGQIRALSKAVAVEDVPAALRRASGKRASARKTTARKATRKRTARPKATKASGAKRSRKAPARKKAGARKTAKR